MAGLDKFKKKTALLGLLIALFLMTISVFFPSKQYYQASLSNRSHSGYFSLSDSCPDCHDVWTSAESKMAALSSEYTVSAVCSSCHFTGEVNPYLQKKKTNSLGAVATAYKLPTSRISSGHFVNLGSGTFLFSDGQEAEAGYIPGGSKPLQPNLNLGISGSESQLLCVSCHPAHGKRGKILGPKNKPVYLKMLLNKPNGSLSKVKINSWPAQGGRWCLACHDQLSSQRSRTGLSKKWLNMKSASSGQETTIYHNHPDKFCLDCHNSASASIDDFPHTSSSISLLVANPDELCLICHQPGKLP